MQPADLEYVVQLQEWLNRDGLTYPAMLMERRCQTTSPSTGSRTRDRYHPRTCWRRLKIRIIGTNINVIHPMHMHGGPFTVVAHDGITLSPTAPFDGDVTNVGPDQRYDALPARLPGQWIFHCRIPHHTLNNNREEHGGGGLTSLLDVAHW